MNIEIKNRWTGAVVFSGDYENLKAAVLAAIASDADLSDADLRRADLSAADLSAADLRRADLSAANLSAADLSAADLRRADLSAADLSAANLSAANLSAANLSAANLSDADLSAANLSDADLSAADLSAANLSAADLRRADLSAKEGTWNPEYSVSFKPDPTLARRVAEAASQEGALDMSNWHNSCGTTHCLAGWAVHLSGPAGYALEKMTSPAVAGSILLPEASHLFFKSNDEAKSWCQSILAKDPLAEVSLTTANSLQG